MLKNYLLVAYRNLLKNKSYVIINTLGLGIAMACCITAYILLAYNIEFDEFHRDEKVENIYRLECDLLLNEKDPLLGVHGPLPIGPMATEDISGIKRFTRYSMLGTNISFEDNAFNERVSFADSTLFEMFDFPSVQGNLSSFKDLHSIVISREMAEKYFGDENPIGKILTLNFAREVEKQMMVGAVVEDVPVNSSIVFDFLIRMEHFAEMRAVEEKPWADWNVPGVFYELDPNADPETIAASFDRYAKRRNEAKTDQKVERYRLVPFKQNIDLSQRVWSSINTPIELEPLIVFTTLGVMIILIACFNLTNTSIAMTSYRLKEIGLRKTVGAKKSQIVIQFLMETVLIILLAVLVGYNISLVIVPEFTSMWDIPYGMEDLNGINTVIMLLSVVFMTALLAGIYPALFSSRLNTVELLKGMVRIKGTNALTRSLVTIQFAISVIVLIAGVVFIRNTQFQEGIQFGYDKDQLLTVSVQNLSEVRAMESKANSHPKIESIAYTDHQVGASSYPSPVKFNNVIHEVQHLAVGRNYFETIGLEFVQGRPFDVDKTNDFEFSTVVSRQFLDKVGLQGDPIGQVVEIHNVRRKIVGVIEDFVDNIWRSKDPEPFVFYPAIPETYKLMVFKAQNSDLVEVNEFLEKTWKENFPTKPYISKFQEDVVMEESKQTNDNLEKIFLFLTVLGAMLSASGIFALASLNIAKRTKEIGIRKALGASIANIVLLINKEFVIILSIAAVLGAIAAYFGTAWLLDLIYAYHISVEYTVLVICSIFIFLLGVSTTSLTIYRGARANPTDTLRVD
ncbi:ABC transporter permease [Reichenbachiella ulvae]|uniref:ABC transporter permease n=1 Tax=Reichenbachiella ulvae TaxID=2980104 RepID=A0ABT3CYJ6_9BACT|nr:ABC transporter permease [Reichenbachiella ulvae]MCV9388288.1 ABC transporter permease [Reichenbachiella ulvae]